MPNNFIKEVISGGQTGVDRAALDVAIEFKIPHSGWCPYERKAEDGIISRKYNLKEAPAPTPEENLDPNAIYNKRTELNVRDSDGTLVIVENSPIGGTLYTIEMAQKYKKSFFVYNLATHFEFIDLASWIIKNNIHKLNVAGPRASQAFGIYDLAYKFLKKLLSHELLNREQQIPSHGSSYRP